MTTDYFYQNFCPHQILIVIGLFSMTQSQDRRHTVGNCNFLLL